jgi:hypothetical protein
VIRARDNFAQEIGDHCKAARGCQSTAVSRIAPGLNRGVSPAHQQRVRLRNSTTPVLIKTLRRKQSAYILVHKWRTGAPDKGKKMQGENISNELSQAFPPAVRAAFVSAIRRAAKHAADGYRPELGWTAHLFGTACYHFACFECEKMIGSAAGAEIARIPKPSALDFKLRVNGFKTAIHRVGSSADDPIAASFPSSPGSPGNMARENWEQMNLPLEYTSLQQFPRNVVIAYMSNPEQGLCAAYLCIPDGSSEGGRVNHWGYTEILWKRSDGLSDLPPSPDFPPPAPDTDPVISIRRGIIEKQSDVASA